MKTGSNKPSIKYDYKKMSEPLCFQPIQYSCLSDTLPKYEVVVVVVIVVVVVVIVVVVVVVVVLVVVVVVVVHSSLGAERT